MPGRSPSGLTGSAPAHRAVVDDRRRDLFRGVACDQVDDAVDEGGVIER